MSFQNMEFSVCILYNWNLNAKCIIWIQSKTSSEKKACLIHIQHCHAAKQACFFCADYL